MSNRISRRSALASISAAVAGTAMTAHRPANAQPPDRPNLLVILSDDQNHRALGCAGNAEIQTPVLDHLAAEGTHFTHCFASNPICTPSRACMQTGQYGFTNGVTFFGHPINEEAPRLARILSDAGYACGYTGKWHNNKRPFHHGFAHMRNVFLGGMHDYDGIPVVQGESDKSAVAPGNPTDVFTQGALDLIAHDLPEPWCLFVCYTAPHDPRTPPAEYEAMYPPESVSLPENFMPEPPFDPGTLGIRDEKLLERPLDPDIVRREIGRYYGMITHMDQQIGRITQHLRESGAWDKTVTIFGGDHGLALGSHGLLGKQTLYEEGVRTPLIVRGPGVQQGVESAALVNLMDIMPTCCQFAGAPVPDTVEAHGLKPICTGNADAGRDHIFCHYHDLFRSVRTDRYKLILHLKTGREELFDLQADPYELSDRIDSADHRDVLDSLRGRLKALRDERGDTGAAV